MKTNMTTNMATWQIQSRKLQVVPGYSLIPRNWTFGCKTFVSLVRSSLVPQGVEICEMLTHTHTNAQLDKTTPLTKHYESKPTHTHTLTTPPYPAQEASRSPPKVAKWPHMATSSLQKDKNIENKNILSFELSPLKTMMVLHLSSVPRPRRDPWSVKTYSPCCISY